MKKTVKVLLCTLPCMAATSLLADTFIQTNFVNPEALAIDETGSFVYISVPGELGGKDGDGLIARMPVDGGDVEIWLDGLNGPKGSQIVGNTLYVVEAAEVLAIDLTTKDIQATALPENGFILDLAVNAQGDVFVTDTPLNTIYKISDGEVSVLAQNDDFGFPNGIEATPDGGFVLATWGSITDFNTWETSEAGRFVHINADGEILGKSEPLANFDGVESSGGKFFATGFNDGSIHSFDSSSFKSEKTRSLDAGAADIAFHGDKTLIVNYNTGSIQIMDNPEQ